MTRTVWLCVCVVVCVCVRGCVCMPYTDVKVELIPALSPILPSNAPHPPRRPSFHHSSLTGPSPPASPITAAVSMMTAQPNHTQSSGRKTWEDYLNPHNSLSSKNVTSRTNIFLAHEGERDSEIKYKSRNMLWVFVFHHGKTLMDELFPSCCPPTYLSRQC